MGKKTTKMMVTVLFDIAKIVVIGFVALIIESIITFFVGMFFLENNKNYMGWLQVINCFTCFLGIVIVIFYVKKIQKRSLDSLLIRNFSLHNVFCGGSIALLMFIVMSIVNYISGMKFEFAYVDKTFLVASAIGWLIESIDESVFFIAFPITTLAKKAPIWISIVNAIFFYTLFVSIPFIGICSWKNLLVYIVNRITLITIVICLEIAQKSIFGGAAFLFVWNYFTYHIVGYVQSGNIFPSLIVPVFPNQYVIWIGDKIHPMTGLNLLITEIISFILVVLYIWNKKMLERYKDELFKN